MIFTKFLGGVPENSIETEESISHICYNHENPYKGAKNKGVRLLPLLETSYKNKELFQGIDHENEPQKGQIVYQGFLVFSGAYTSRTFSLTIGQ